MFRDETVYPMPESFDPGRFLKNGKLDPLVKDPEESIFGAGRRYGSCDHDFLIFSWPSYTPAVLKCYP